MRCLYRFLCVAFCVLAVSLTVGAQELSFRHYAHPLPATGSVLAFQQNSNKEIQVVTTGGIGLFNGKNSKSLFSFAQLGITNVQQALFVGPSTLLLLTESKLYSLNTLSGKKNKLSELDFEKVFYHAALKQVYASTKNALYVLQENISTIKRLDLTEGVNTLIPVENGTIVVGTQRLSIYNSTWQLMERIQVPERIIDSYYANDRVLLLTSKAVYSKESNTALKKLYELGNQQVSCLLEDQAGRLWIGLKDAGALLLKGAEQLNLREQGDFPLRSVEGIYESSDYALWFYGKEGVAYKPFSTPFQKFSLGRQLGGDIIQDVHAIDSVKEGVLTKNGFYHIIEGESVQASQQITLPFIPAFSRIINAQQRIHVSSSGELYFSNQGKSHQLALNKAIKQVFAFDKQSLLLDSEGKLQSFNHQTYKVTDLDWRPDGHKPVAQSGQYLVYAEEGAVKRWDSFTNTHTYLAPGTAHILHPVLYKDKLLLYVSDAHTVMYASAKEAPVQVFQLPEEVTITGLSIAGNTLWLSTADKLYQLALAHKNGQITVVLTNVFDAREHALELPLRKSVENLAGSSLLASATSLQLYHSLGVLPDVTPPGLSLEKLTIKHKDSLRTVAFGEQDSLQLTLADNEQLIIDAFAIQYGSANKVRLKYRFLSAEHQWYQAVDNQMIVLSGLEPGTHVLELAAESEQGVKSVKRKRLLLSVSPTAAYSWWSVAGASVGFILFGFFAYSGIKSAKEGKAREAKEKYEKELLKLQRKSHEQMMQAESLKQVNELISAQKAELEDKNKQIVAQKYELALTNNQIKQQKDLIQRTSESLESSINYAKRIQTALMGDEIRVKEAIADSFVFFKPRDQVSGDFFWFAKSKNTLGEEVLIIAAVDCTGHGVPGAIVSVVGIQLLNAIVNAKGITDPANILTELNTDLLHSLNYEQTKINDGMDMSLCTINLHQQKLYFAGAKNPLFIIKNGELEIIKGDKHAIGGQKLHEEKTYQTHEICLDSENKQMFYLFSDGYQDQFGGSDQSKFMLRSFKSLLLDISEKPSMEQKYLLATTLNEWQGKESQTDDILVIGFRL